MNPGLDLEAVSGLPGSADNSLHQLVTDHWTASWKTDETCADTVMKSKYAAQSPCPQWKRDVLNAFSRDKMCRRH